MIKEFARQHEAVLTHGNLPYKQPSPPQTPRAPGGDGRITSRYAGHLHTCYFPEALAWAIISSTITHSWSNAGLEGISRLSTLSTAFFTSAQAGVHWG